MITEIKNTNLVAVKIPAYTHNYSYNENENCIYAKVIDSENIVWFSYQLPIGNYKILGTVTKDKINFDCEPYLILMEDSFGEGEYKYRDYTVESDRRFRTKEESFYSRLAANGLYFVNPITYPEEDKYEGGEDWAEREIEDIITWQSYEDKLIKGKLLIIENCKIWKR